MLNRAAVVRHGLSRFATVGAYVFFVVSVSFAFGLYGHALREVCVQSNKDRMGIAAFATNAFSRTSATAKAVLASKTSSPQERAAALRNLAGVKALQARLDKTLPQQNCPSGWIP